VLRDVLAVGIVAVRASLLCLREILPQDCVGKGSPFVFSYGPGDRRAGGLVVIATIDEFWSLSSESFYSGSQWLLPSRQPHLV
jgi:hypothetical protein